MLRDIQLAFLDAINKKEIKVPLPILIESDASQEQLISIYRDSSKQGLVNTLKSVFDVCRQIMGTKNFESMAWHYVEHNPSYSPNVNDYGANFPLFVKNYEPARKWIYLSQMVQLEWYCHEVSRAPLLPTNLDFSLIELALLNDKDIFFEIVPSIALFATDFPLYHLWQMHQFGYTGPRNFIFSGPKSENLIICRNSDGLCLYRVEQELWFVVNAMKNKITLKNMVVHAEQNNIPLDLTAILPTILLENWVGCFQLL